MTSLLVSISETTNSTPTIIKENLLRLTTNQMVVDGLKIIYAHLRGEVPEDQKKGIADQLLDAQESCVIGYLDRVNSILFGLRCPESISEILQRIREGIVDGVARSYTNDVHAHNAFFTEASAMGYGVRPINSSDAFSSILFLHPYQINTIKQAFFEKYTPVAVITALQAEIEGQCRSMGYIGVKEDGYTIKVYSNLQRFLRAILNEEVPYSDLLITKEDGTVIDMNWAFIQDRLWRNLSDRHIVFSTEESRLMTALYAKDEQSSLEAGAGAGAGATNTTSSAMDSASTSMTSTPPKLVELFMDAQYLTILDSLSLEQYPNLIKSIANKESLANALKSHANKMKPTDLIRYLKLIKALFADEAVLKKKHFEELLNQWLREKEPITQLLELELNDPDKIELFLTIFNSTSLIETQITALFPKIKAALLFTLQEKLKLTDKWDTCIEKLGGVHKETLLTLKNESSGYNLLMLATEFQPDVLTSILTKIESFSHGLQAELMNTRAANNYNALTLAARYQPSAFALLLTRIRTFKPAILRNLLGSHLITITAYYQPTAFALLLDQIAPHVLKKWLLAKNSNGYHSLILATLSGREALLKLLSTIKNNPTIFDPEFQKALFMARGNGYHNALMAAAATQPSCVAPLLEIINTFTLAEREEILAKRDITDDKGGTPLMLAIRYQPIAVPALLESIFDLEPRVQIEILTVQNSLGNALILAARAENDTLPMLFTFTKRLTLETRMEIIIATLAYSIKFQPSLAPQFLNFIDSYEEFDTQLRIFACTSWMFSEAIQTHKERLIERRMAAMRTGTSLQQAIYQQLSRMEFHASHKKEAILLALYHLEKEKPSDTPLDAAIRDALINSSSGLYRALNIQRYSLFSRASQTRCFLEVLEASRGALPPSATTPVSTTP